MDKLGALKIISARLKEVHEMIIFKIEPFFHEKEGFPISKKVKAFYGDDCEGFFDSYDKMILGINEIMEKINRVIKEIKE